MGKDLKVHFQNRSSQSIHPVCMKKPALLKSSRLITEVTCKRCLHLIDQKTTEQGGPTPSTDHRVVLIKNGPNRIAVIREIREITQLGLKESKELSDKPYDGRGHAIILEDVDATTAQAAVQKLGAAGATAKVETSHGGVFLPTEMVPGASVPPITTAYREMLRLFLPEEQTSRYPSVNAYLDQFDDDDKTGHRLFPYTAPPRIADIRRWLSAGGIQ